MSRGELPLLSKVFPSTGSVGDDYDAMFPGPCGQKKKKRKKSVGSRDKIKITYLIILLKEKRIV